MRSPLLPLMLAAGCTPTAAPLPDTRPLADVATANAAPTGSSAPETANSADPAPAVAEQPGTDRCEWPKRKGSPPGPGISISDAQVDIARMAAGLPPLSDGEKKSIAERERIDDALEGTIGCEVSQVRGQMPPSHFTFAVDQRLDDVARCLYQPGQARKGKLAVKLAFDADGQPKPARLESSKLDPAMSKCVEDVFSELQPARHQGNPKTGQPLTDDAQANASALVTLELDMPAVR